MRVASVDKADRSTLAVDSTEANFTTIDTAAYQVLHRTTTHEPLRMVQQVQGQKGCEVWHMIVRRYDQRSMSDRSWAYAALIRNISESDRAKDVEQFDNILRNCINESGKYEGRFLENPRRREDSGSALPEHHHGQVLGHIRYPR